MPRKKCVTISADAKVMTFQFGIKIEKALVIFGRNRTDPEGLENATVSTQ